MREFDESKHKRNKLGRFAKMSAKDIAAEIFYEVDDNPLFYYANRRGRVKKDVLSQNEWRIWYEDQNNEEKMYLLNKQSLRRFVRINDKYVLTSGTYVRPKVEMVMVMNSVKSLWAFEDYMGWIYGNK